MKKWLLIIAGLVAATALNAEIKEDEAASIVKSLLQDCKDLNAKDLEFAYRFIDCVNDTTYINQIGYHLALCNPQIWNIAASEHKKEESSEFFNYSLLPKGNSGGVLSAIQTDHGWVVFELLCLNGKICPPIHLLNIGDITSPITGIVLNRYGTHALLSSQDGAVRAWDLVSQHSDLLAEHLDSPQVFCGKASDVIAVAHGAHLCLLNYNGIYAEELATIDYLAAIRTVCFNHDDSLLLVSLDNDTTSIFDCERKKHMLSLPIGMHACSWSDDSSLISYLRSDGVHCTWRPFAAQSDVTLDMVKDVLARMMVCTK